MSEGSAATAGRAPAAIEAGPAVEPLVSPWLTAIAVMCGTFMVVLDTTVVNVSLSHIAGSLSPTVEEATWALTSYIAANAIILPMTGWLAAFFGRKRLLIGSVTAFTIASMLCGLSPNLTVLVIFRVIQGATGGVMQPLSQAVLLEAFPPRDRGKAMGFWGLGVVVAPILGPVLGGWLTDNYSWRWIFYINIPVGVAAVFLTRLWVFDPHYLRRARLHVDYWGLALLAIGAGSLQIMLDKGQEEDWFDSRFIIMLAIAAVAGLTIFCWRELRAKDPILDLHVFKHRTFTIGILLTTALGFVLYGSLVLVPVFLQALLGYPALQAGIAMAPRGFGSFIAMPVVGLLTSRMDGRKLVAVGFALAGWTLLWLGALNLQAGYWDFFWPQFVQGIALGLLFVPLTTVTMGDLAREEIGNASSLFNLVRNVGGSVGIAITETLLTRSRVTHAANLGAHVTPYDTSVGIASAQIGRLFALRAPGVPPQMGTIAALAGMIQRQASLLAFLDLFRLLGVACLVLLPFVFVMRRGHGTRPVISAAE